MDYPAHAVSGALKWAPKKGPPSKHLPMGYEKECVGLGLLWSPFPCPLSTAKPKKSTFRLSRHTVRQIDRVIPTAIAARWDLHHRAIAHYMAFVHLIDCNTTTLAICITMKVQASNHHESTSFSLSRHKQFGEPIGERSKS